MSNSTSNPVKVFFSYCHRDESFKEGLEEHMAQLRREEKLATWSDRELIPGEDWDETIKENLLTSDVVLFLVSSSFIASHACWDVEVTEILKRRDQGGKVELVPVILRPCEWHESILGKFQGLPKDGKAVSTWEDRDEAYLNIVKGIRALLKSFQSKKKEEGSAEG